MVANFALNPDEIDDFVEWREPRDDLEDSPEDTSRWG